VYDVNKTFLPRARSTLFAQDQGKTFYLKTRLFLSFYHEAPHHHMVQNNTVIQCT